MNPRAADRVQTDRDPLVLGIPESKLLAHLENNRAGGFFDLVGNADRLDCADAREALAKLKIAAEKGSPAQRPEIADESKPGKGLFKGAWDKVCKAARKAAAFLVSHGDYSQRLANVKHLKYLSWLPELLNVPVLTALGSLALRVTPALLGVATLFDVGHMLYCLLGGNSTPTETGVAVGRVVMDGALLASAAFLWTVNPWLFMVPSAGLTILDFTAKYVLPWLRGESVKTRNKA